MSDTNRVQMAYKKESTFGAQVTAGNLQILRMTGEALRQDSTVITSEEIRSDRQIANIVRTSVGASGEINFELSYSTYDELFAAALASVSVRAQGSLTMDTLPTDGDTVTIGSTTYTFKDTMASANDIQIEAADLPGTQANFVATINGTGTAGVNYYAGTTTPHPLVTCIAFATNVCVITAKAPGVDGNSIATTETFTAGTNVFDAATLGTTVAGAGWTSEVEITAATISATASDDSFNDSGAGFAFTVGEWVKVSGFTTNPTVNNGWFKIATATASKITVENGSAIVDESAGDSVTITQGASIYNGTTINTFNFEKDYKDVANVLSLITGGAIDTLSLDIPVDGLITGSFGILGSAESSLSSSGAAGYDAATTTVPMSTVNDFKNLFAATVDTEMLNLTLSLSNNLRQRMVAGTLGAHSIGSGTLEITGTLQAYFQDHTLMDQFLNQTESAIAVVLEDAAGNAYVIELPSVRFTSGQRVAGGQNDDVISDMEFTAFMSATESKTIKISRVAA